MISFKEFLTEARMAPLYHGTSVYFLEDIVKNGIRPLTTQSNKQIRIRPNNVVVSLSTNTEIPVLVGVSLSRNFNFSRHYGSGVVLELDQQKLTQNYRIVPFNFFSSIGLTRRQAELGGDHKRNEYEEFVITKKPIPFSYVKRVFVDPDYFSGRYNIIKELREKYGSTFVREMK